MRQAPAKDYTLMATLFSDCLCLCHQFNELFKDGNKYYINHEDVLFHSLKANK